MSAEQMKAASDSKTVVERFTNVLQQILTRHNPVVPTMALGILELKEKSGPEFFFQVREEPFLFFV